MARFRSNEELFQFVTDLIDGLEAAGHARAADELREGLQCINGLTDGWAMFLQRVENAQVKYGHVLSAADAHALETIRETAAAAIHCR